MLERDCGGEGGGGRGEGVISGIQYSKNEVGTSKVKWIQGVIVGLGLKSEDKGCCAEMGKKLQKIFTASRVVHL